MIDGLKSVGVLLLGPGPIAVVFAALIGAWFKLKLERFKTDQTATIEQLRSELIGLRGAMRMLRKSKQT